MTPEQRAECARLANDLEQVNAFGEVEIEELLRNREDTSGEQDDADAALILAALREVAATEPAVPVSELRYEIAALLDEDDVDAPVHPERKEGWRAALGVLTERLKESGHG